MSEPPERSGRHDLILRPSWEKRGFKALKRNWPWVLGSAVTVVAFAVSAALKDPSWTDNGAWLAGGVALIVVLVALDQRHRVFVRGDMVGESGWPLRRRRSFPVSDVGRIWRVTKRAGNQPPWPHLVVLDRQGKLLLDLRADVWSDADLARLMARLGQHAQGSFDRVVSGREFRVLFPKR